MGDRGLLGSVVEAEFRDVHGEHFFRSGLIACAIGLEEEVESKRMGGSDVDDNMFFFVSTRTSHRM